MKVAISIFDDISKNHGATVRAKRVYEVFKKHSDVTFITSSSRNLDGTFKSIMIKLPSARPFVQMPFWLIGETKVLLKTKFDLIYLSSDWLGFVIYYFFSKIRSYKIVIEAHGILSDEYRELSQTESTVKSEFGLKYSICRLLERAVVKHSKSVVALSRGIYDFYSKYNPNIELIPVFIDTNHFRFDPEKRRKIRQRYGLSEGKLIGVIGPFYSTYNKPSLEFVYENIDKFDSRIDFVIIGPCPSKKKHDRLVYTGFVDDYAGFLSCLDAVLVPCKIATSGPLNKIVEAMSCSLPVFTTPKGLVGLDYAEDGKNIFVCQESELVKKVNDSFFEDNLMNKISANALKTVETYYSMDANAKKLQSVMKIDSEPQEIQPIK